MVCHARAPLVAAVAGCLAAGFACSRWSADPEPFYWDPASFDGAAAMREVQAFVDLGPRVAATASGERAAVYLVERFGELGMTARIDAFEDEAPGGKATFRNVIARVPGTNPRRMLIIGSHYDTKKNLGDDYVGANDSGSSTGALLELARLAAENARTSPPPGDLVFVAFDGEECAVSYGPQDGFHGSRRFVRQLIASNHVGRVRAMILMDMIGDRDLSVTIPVNSASDLAALAFDAATEEGVREAFTIFEQAILDDHTAFSAVGIPAIDLIDFQFGSRPGEHDYWHTTEDTMDKLSADSLQVVGRVVIRMINELMNDLQ